MKSVGWLTALLALLAATHNVQANEALITARIEGTNFINTTPKATYCNSFQGGAYCVNKWTVDLPITYRKWVDVNAANARDKVYIKLPPRQALTLQNQLTGQTATMFIAFADVSQRVSYSNETVVGLRPIGCVAYGGMGGGPGYSQFLWSVTNTTNPPACVSDKSGNTQVEDSEFTRSGVMFRPEFPSAASLAPGRWEGTLDYPVGMGQGFDFGNIVQSSTDAIRFRVRFDVQHDIRVDFPADGTEVKLAPQGGWESAINSSKAPVRLFHDSPLRLWAGAAFKVYLACEHLGNAYNCRMKNQANDHYVQVDTAISLPGAFTSDGQPVDRLPLYSHVGNGRIITPTTMATNAPGTLHFDVTGRRAAEMLLYPGSRYSGAITIIYDANP
ncbi:hypothetical protein [Pseudomonas sp. CFBP 13719]|uniref:hypothetical protein n=1 Tax=Pseudomonas sp. CFBP 13719 TaxID=2775303 RepID=UPI00177AC2AC|nr:hypothetical protein [Pseudomonas sp. CFBP 13719]MBD8681137.1 hypothetical protein [Pseudomonas sp. CFBP 13719]